MYIHPSPAATPVFMNESICESDRVNPIVEQSDYNRSARLYKQSIKAINNGKLKVPVMYSVGLSACSGDMKAGEDEAAGSYHLHEQYRLLKIALAFKITTQFDAP
jgi:hypothetical protein